MVPCVAMLGDAAWRGEPLATVWPGHRLGLCRCHVFAVIVEFYWRCLALFGVLLGFEAVVVVLGSC